MFVGYLKGVELITGETYLFRGKKVILKEVHKTEEMYGYKNTEFWFQHYNSLLMFKVLAEELMKSDFRKCFEVQDFSKWLDENKATGLINNDMLDSWRYSLSFQSGLGLDNFSLKNNKLPRKVIFNDKKKATTLLYGDEATVVKACKGDKYDKEKGFLMAFFQKQSGLSKTQAKKYLKKITEQE